MLLNTFLSSARFTPPSLGNKGWMQATCSAGSPNNWAIIHLLLAPVMTPPQHHRWGWKPPDFSLCPMVLPSSLPWRWASGKAAGMQKPALAWIQGHWHPLEGSRAWHQRCVEGATPSSPLLWHPPSPQPAEITACPGPWRPTPTRSGGAGEGGMVESRGARVQRVSVASWRQGFQRAGLKRTEPEGSSPGLPWDRLQAR